MSISKLKRVTSRLIILSLLVIGLVVLPMSPTERRVSASENCEECWTNYQICLADCAPVGTCQDICWFDYLWCRQRCE